MGIYENKVKLMICSEEGLRKEGTTEPTLRRPLFEFMPQFEHSSYDFMVPEGTNPVCSLSPTCSNK